MNLAIALDDQSALPLHCQLYEELRRAILMGRLLPGQRLPSTRALAQSLKVSRGTVKLSYEQLLSEGYLETVPGSGTFVCVQIPDPLLQTAASQTLPEEANPPLKLSRYGMNFAATQLPNLNQSKPPIDFCYWRPAFEQLPLKIWRQLLGRHCQYNPDLLDYTPDLLGYQPLREAIANYLARSRAVKCEANQVMIVNSTQQSLDLITRLLLDLGDWVAIEEPGYLTARRIFLTQGANLLPIPVDESGLKVNHLPTVSKPQIKLVYVTPSHQFPTGATLSLPRRLELLTWAQKVGAVIVEDDYDSEYRYGERPIPALQGLSEGNSVIYIGTFSKVLFPSLRIGYLVLPPALVNVFASAKGVTDRQASLLEQYALTDLINEGHLERHIRRMRHLYSQRRQILVQTLKATLGEQITILGKSAGMHLMVRLPTSLNNKAILRCAAQVGVGLVSAEPYYLEPGGKGEFLLGYAVLNEQQIQEGVCRFAQALNMRLSEQRNENCI